MTTEQAFFETRDCLCLASRRAARTITRAFDKELRRHGIRATQFSLLAILTLKGEQSIGALAEVLSADRTTLTRNLALLEEEELIRIRPGEDARARVVTVTPKGRRTVQAAFPAWRKVQDSLTAALGNQAADSLRRISRTTRI